MIIAQISDLHVMPAGSLAFGRFDTAGNLARCVESIMRLDPAPDAVLATGDLVDAGAPAEYRRLRELLAPLAMPLYPIPGNHDERAALRAAFPDQACFAHAGEALHYAVEDHELRLIALDTVIPGADGGALAADQLDWLEVTLGAAPGKPTLLFMHHPPFRTGIGYMDEIALDRPGAERLAAIVERHPQIERVICGHVHRGIHVRWHGTTVSACPSTAFQYSFDLRPGSPPVATREPSAYQVHYWNGADLVTHTLAVAA